MKNQKQECLDYVKQSMQTLVKTKMVKIIDADEMIYDQRKLEDVIDEVRSNPKWFMKYLDTETNDHVFWSRTVLDIVEKMNVKPRKQDMRGIQQGISTVCILMSSDWLPTGEPYKKMKKQFPKMGKKVLNAQYEQLIKMHNGFLSLCKQ